MSEKAPKAKKNVKPKAATPPEFPVIAERIFQLRGPAERQVIVRIGIPEADPLHQGVSRCAYQVTGLSDDAVHYACGVDAFQSLHLTYCAIHCFMKTNASVLAAFHKDFSLTWEEQPWELVLPFPVCVFDLNQYQKLENFIENELFRTT